MCGTHCKYCVIKRTAFCFRFGYVTTTPYYYPDKSNTFLVFYIFVEKTKKKKMLTNSLKSHVYLSLGGQNHAYPVLTAQCGIQTGGTCPTRLGAFMT